MSRNEVAILGAGMHPWGKWGRSFIDYGVTAARAGLARGDIVVALNGAEIKSSDTLRNAIAMIRPGTAVELQVVRKGGARETVRPKLGELPSDNQVPRVLRGQRQPQPQPQPQRRVRPRDPFDTSTP